MENVRKLHLVTEKVKIFRLRRARKAKNYQKLDLVNFGFGWGGVLPPLISRLMETLVIIVGQGAARKARSRRTRTPGEKTETQIHRTLTTDFFHRNENKTLIHERTNYPICSITLLHPIQQETKKSIYLFFPLSFTHPINEWIPLCGNSPPLAYSNSRRPAAMDHCKLYWRPGPHRSVPNSKIQRNCTLANACCPG